MTDNKAKRLLDIAISALGLSCLWPLLAVMAMLIKVESPGPLLFRQTRIGYKGRPFNCYKLRTMRMGASPPPPRVEDWSAYLFSPPGRRSPRVTRIGNVLRITTLDELPQLLNVLRGEMSLVGPRPEIPELAGQYPSEYHRRHEVKPGMTCLAAIRGRSDLTYHQTMLYDLDYVDNHSLLRDIYIIARTMIVVARRQGAR